MTNIRRVIDLVRGMTVKYLGTEEETMVVGGMDFGNKDASVEYWSIGDDNGKTDWQRREDGKVPKAKQIRAMAKAAKMEYELMGEALSAKDKEIKKLRQQVKELSRDKHS